MIGTVQAVRDTVQVVKVVEVSPGPLELSLAILLGTVITGVVVAL